MHLMDKASRLCAEVEARLKADQTMRPAQKGDAELLRLLHELKGCLIELELQNEKLRNAQRTLEEARDCYLCLYDFAPVGYITLDQDGMIERSNLAGAMLLGVGRGELQHHYFEHFVAMQDRDRWRRYFLSVLEGNKSNCELALQTDDGSLISAQLDCVCPERTSKAQEVHITITDITDCKASEARQAESASLLHATLESANDAILAVDLNGAWILHNQKFVDLWHIPGEIIAAKNKEAALACMLGQLENADGLISAVRELYVDPGKNFTDVLQFKDGKVIEYYSVPQHIKGKVAGMVWSFRDITLHKQIEQAMMDMDQRKNAFLAMLSHELRNPLAAICNATHFLGQLELANPKALWAQKIIADQASHLAHMVGDLHDASRTSRNRIILKKETIVLAPLIERVAEFARMLAERKEQQFSVRLPAQAVQLEGDPVRLSQVLFNLIDNAIKYTQNGGQIELAACMAGEEVEISVRDNGMGIATDLLPHVFDLFRQGECTMGSDQGGLGIGLTLVQRLVTMHGGRVKAYSKGPGFGSTFCVWLPAKITQTAIIEAADNPHPAATVRVLVVDDNHNVASSTALLLELDGHNVRVAHTGQAALELIPEFLPQLVLLDINLRGMDGFRMARELRQLAAGRSLLLAAVTGCDDENTKTLALASGCDYFLIKPMAYEMLNALLREAAGSLAPNKGCGNTLGT